ncbi:3-ketodihydrosphingosine reductase TSC10 [Psilocybe cubensis]|uniref:Oxidoreductase n=2 Tax=Psilocybe cubensis TaxID=181762 RepID=A0A8H7XKB0_PSICU|nr:3-ketodihydrosphingosine reductase TSC10 [Psilocybe cubensis]KAH9476538.1 3-ketodihydrosphingosine reductase TSC10 [Psilocybe cubensis]
MFGLFSKKWNPEGKHVYITGGSSGLGLGLAHILAQKGAHISIVARSQSKLDEAIESIEKLRVNPSQIFKAYSHALDSGDAAAKALQLVAEAHGGELPDAIFTCAGSSKPMFFIDTTEQDMVDGMTNAYWLQAWTAWAATKQMVKAGKKGAKIVFVSSLLGYMSFLGYTSYTPGKHALRGLADTLHSELKLYGIDVHIYFPGTMFTPGYEEENKTKPAITQAIEGTDGLTSDQAAQALYKGVVNGNYHISGDLITDLFHASTRGSAPRNNWLLEGLYDLVAYFAVPVWRSGVESQVLAHRDEHQTYLAKKGFFS